MLAIEIGVISTTRKVKIQLDAVARAADFVRMARGAYSAGRSQGMASKPTAKKKLKRNSITIATRPHGLLPSATVPARMAMLIPCPAQAKSIKLRRPSRSSNQIGINDERKYAMPLKPARSKAVEWGMPTETSKITGAYCENVSQTGVDGCLPFVRSTYVGDEINSRELLHELTTDTEKRPTTKSLWTGFEHSEKGGAACCCSLFFQCVFNLVHLSIDDSVILCNGARILL